VRYVLLLALAALLASPFLLTNAAEPTREEVVAAMQPYDGATKTGVDPSTLTGKIMAGYQGWFCADGDAAGMGWYHYQNRGQFRPGRCNIDLWPDVSELDEDEKYSTEFKLANGKPAAVFSSDNKKTVLRHFRWMEEYGIDGVFVQRFVGETRAPSHLRHFNTVLASCREGANLHGRCYAVMYDLSGLRAGGTAQCIEDWKLLVDRMRIGRDKTDPAYLRHNGRPVVVVWGIGFNDGRRYTLEECDKLIQFLKDDPQYGGNTVMVGVPTNWRTLDRDTVSDPALHAILLKADIISPWTVGRYATLEDVESHAQRRWKPDREWCAERRREYLPVVFPGFSWHNMKPIAKLDQIPRQQGKFLWKQFVEARKAGSVMAYVAMFDEMDEGTAIFKCTNDVPTGASRFVAFEGLPSDHYLWLTGQGGAMLRGRVPPSDGPPARAR